MNNIISPTIFIGFFIFAKTFCIYLVTKYVFMALIKKTVTKTKAKWDNEFFPLFSKITYLFIWVAGGSTLLHSFDVNLSGIWATIGGMSIVIGLAVKDSISNLITGVMIMIYRPFRENDQIEYGGNKVTVLDIGYHHCKFLLEGDTDAILIVRNQDLTKKDIKNFTLAKERKQNED